MPLFSTDFRGPHPHRSNRQNHWVYLFIFGYTTLKQQGWSPVFYYKNDSLPRRNSRNASFWWSLNLQPRYHHWPKQNKLQRYRTSTFCSTSLVKVPFGCSPFGDQQILVLIVKNPFERLILGFQSENAGKEEFPWTSSTTNHFFWNYISQ